MKKYLRFVEAKLPEIPKVYRKPSDFMDCLKGVYDGSVDPEEMKNFFGLDLKKFSVSEERWSKESSLNNLGVDILLNNRYLTELLNIEDFVPDWILYITSSYSGYEYDMYGEEKYYARYLDDKCIQHCKTLAHKYGYDLNEDDYEKTGYHRELDISGLFEYLGLTRLKDDLKFGIQEIKENSVVNAAKAELKELPFDLDHKYGSDFKFSLSFSWKEMLDYINKNLPSVEITSLKDFLEHIDCDGLSPNNIEYGTALEHESQTKWDHLHNNIGNELEYLIDSPEDVIPYIIRTDNLELFLKFKDDANYRIYYDGYKYGYWSSDDRKRVYLFKLVSENGKIEKYFESIEFQKPFMEEYPMEEEDKYNLLKDCGIMHSEIRNVWGWIEEAEKFNM